MKNINLHSVQSQLDELFDVTVKNINLVSTVTARRVVCHKRKDYLQSVKSHLDELYDVTNITCREVIETWHRKIYVQKLHIKTTTCRQTAKHHTQKAITFCAIRTSDGQVFDRRQIIIIKNRHWLPLEMARGRLLRQDTQKHNLQTSHAKRKLVDKLKSI